MSTFDTPASISVTLDLIVGDVRIEASDRADTVVDVRPRDPGKEGDVTAARETDVTFAAGRLVVRTPKRWRHLKWHSGNESVDVRIELPAGSDVHGGASMGALRVVGPLGDCSYKSGLGDIAIDRAGSVTVKTGAGDVTVDRAAGGAEITTGSGSLEVGRIDGPAVLRNGNGDTWVGDVGGDVRSNAANGSITIDSAGSGVAAKSANGRIDIGEVRSGAVVAQTAMGSVEVGVRDGVAAWLELHTRFGNVVNELGSTGRPASGEDAVEIRARTSYGDITIRRSSAIPSEGSKP
jgi:hypothetical protein